MHLWFITSIFVFMGERYGAFRTKMYGYRMGHYHQHHNNFKIQKHLHQCHDLLLPMPTHRQILWISCSDALFNCPHTLLSSIHSDVIFTKSLTWPRKLNPVYYLMCCIVMKIKTTLIFINQFMQSYVCVYIYSRHPSQLDMLLTAECRRNTMC